MVVGAGPEGGLPEGDQPPNVTFLSDVDDAQLAWLYDHCFGLVGAPFEDFGLTPIEANVFGKLVAALQQGGYLETVRHGETGAFFPVPEAAAIASTVKGMGSVDWDADAIKRHAGNFSEATFVARMQGIVEEERSKVAFA